MRACEMEVIATGNEIVFGQLVDTNSAWIAKISTEHGAKVRRLSCIGDRLEDIVQAIKRGVDDGRNILVITGGLGPSEDDLTIEAIALATDRKIIYDKKALQMLEAKCNEFSIHLTDRRKKMARLVMGATPLENPMGLAPGILLNEGQCMIVALPGIPQEMKLMFQHYVLSIISKISRMKSAAINFNLYMTLEDLLTIIFELRNQFPDIYIKRHARPPNLGHQESDCVSIDIVVWGETIHTCESQLSEIREKLNTWIQEKGGRISEKMG